MLWIDSRAMSTRGWPPPTRRLGHPISCRCRSCWYGATVLIATPASSQTSRNLQATGKVRPGPDSRCRGHRRDHTDAGCARRLVGHGRCLCRRDGLRPAHAKSRATCISESTRGGCWCGAKSTSSTAASSCATTAGSRF